MPLAALSRYDNGLRNLYTSFTQEDGAPLYSVHHKAHVWGSVGTTWRTTKEEAIECIKLSVGPNPFSCTFKVKGVRKLLLNDDM